MKPSYEVLSPTPGHSFTTRTFGPLAFTAPFHFHPEYELTLITAGSGKRYIGSHMADFHTDDLVLIGPHLPHCWKLETPAEKEAPPASAIVIHFSGDFLGKDFFSRTELAAIQRLLHNSRSGTRFLHTEAPLHIRTLAAEKNDFNRLLGLLEILQELATAKDALPLDTRGITAALNPADRERIHPIFAYILDNFNGEISLDKAAAIAGMTPNAFCRYFKKITRKTFMDTVIDHRLALASRELTLTNKPISDICFDSGFGDISHFYKTFRMRMQISPLHYRKKFMREVAPRSAKT